MRQQLEKGSEQSVTAQQPGQGPVHHVWESGPSPNCSQWGSPTSGWISGRQQGSALPRLSVHSYQTLARECEALMQKYLHLLQIMETEKTVANQRRQQIEDGEINIEQLKAEVTAG